MPDPCRLPLPGGAAGAEVELHLLRSGLARDVPAWFVRPSGLTGPLRAAAGLVTGGDVPIISFAIVHPGAGTILVDAGIHPKAGRPLRTAPDGSVRHQLSERGVDPDGVETILMTHLHLDHTSGLGDFPGTTVLVSRPEWEAFHGGRPMLHGYEPKHLRGGHDFRLLEHEAADLFGDGSVRLLPTPGHTHGHVSLVVRTRSGPVLVCGDAIYTTENLRDGREPLRCEDRPAWQRSVATLREWIAEHPDAPFVPGHDAAHWASLKPTY